MEPTEEKKCCETKKRCCCRKMPGVFIILVGVAVLLRALEVLDHKTFWVSISILVIVGGLLAICRNSCKCCDKS
jgi:phosphate starvation-inducible membrane PsiE